MSGFTRREPSIPGEIVGANSKHGHLLRSQQTMPDITRSENTNVVIIGGGIAGLAASRSLSKAGVEHHILELEAEVGGNARSGENRVSAFPWGAHYVPVPGKGDTLVTDLFRELGVITGTDSQEAPIYNEKYLCYAPEERLFIHGRWQEGLLPQVGVAEHERKEYQRFFKQMATFRSAVGRDGKRAFAIPVDQSSRDERFLGYDRVTMDAFLQDNGYSSRYLQWYINYCLRDDYGTPSSQVSAWAGIHYFASRASFGANVDEYAVLTWPEGNGWIVKEMKARTKGEIRCNALVLDIHEHEEKVSVTYLDTASMTSSELICNYVIYAAPRFTAPYVIRRLREQKGTYLPSFEYAPWMVASITLSGLPEDSAQGTAWDNVIFESDSLGYVSATHQQLRGNAREHVWSYYLPLSHAEPSVARKEASEHSAEEWKNMVVRDLSRAHRDIRHKISRIDIWLWGHGMIRPRPNFIWGSDRREAQAPLGRVHFAHSDMSGISIFEEAFYRGTVAADEVLKRI